MGETLRRGALLLAALGWIAGCDSKGGAGGDATVRVVVPFDAGVLNEDASLSGACPLGERRCIAADRYQACVSDHAGGTQWDIPTLCPQAGQTCSDGHCCAAGCNAGATVCTPEGLRRCVQGADGCYALGDPEPCPGGCTPDGRCPGGAPDAGPPDGCPGACTPGEQRCAGPDGYVVCGDGTPECWQFSAPLACAEGQTCADGRCTGCIGSCDLPGPVCVDEHTRRLCANDDRGCSVLHEEACPGSCVDGQCVAGCDECPQGSERCVSGTRQVCQQQQGCWRWADSGACQGGCEDRCGPEGQRTCNPDGSSTRCARNAAGCLAPVDLGGCTPGARDCNNADAYRVCEADADGCFHWGVHACEGGANCFAQAQVCFGACPDACDIGAIRCRDHQNYEVCQLRDGCPAWVARPCNAGADCVDQQSACTGQCDAACNLGDRQCLDAHTYQECARGADGCPAWHQAMCAGDVDCRLEPRACFGQCADACTEGAKECLDGQSWRECVQGFDGCPEWQQRFCQGFQDCAASPALCYGDCSDECQEGDKVCDGQDGFRQCVRDPGGCTRWERHPCVEGDCFSARDACLGDCQHECQPDERRCADGQTYETCEADFEGCRHWSQRFCSNGAVCQERPNACYGDCQDQCTLDSQQCVSSDRYRTCVAGADGCAAWQEHPCANGADCFSGRDGCFGACQNECEEGARECVDGQDWRECVRDFSGCTRWEQRGCFGAGDCRATPGACFGTCFNACAAGDAQCSGFDAFQSCVLAPDGQCTVWSADRPCAGAANCLVDESACTGR